MGIVIKQSFWGTVIAYLGVLIGYFNTLYFRPEFFSMGEIGIFNLITSNAMIISPFCSAGMPATWIREFPGMKENENLRIQYFSFQVSVVILFNLLVLLLGYLTWDWIEGFFSQGSPEYVKFLGVTAIIIVVNSLFEMLNSYCRSILQILVPSFIRDIFLRAGSIVLVAGLAFNWWDFEIAASGLAVNYLLAFIILFFYLIFFRNLRFSLKFDLVSADIRKRAINLGGYFMLLALSFAVMNNMSLAQIAGYLGDETAGIFTTCFFIGVIVEMPRRNMLKVISPIFSKALNEKDMDLVQRMYIKGSLTMTVIGVLLLIGILTNVDDLFAFVPQGSAFATGYWVVVAVCAAKLTTMLFSFSSEIIVFSDRYQYSLYAQLVSAVLLILLNIWLINEMGLLGAGLSYFIAMLFHSLIRFYMVWKWFGLTPFARAHVHLLIAGGVVYGLTVVIPFPFDPMINIILRGIFTTAIFVTLIFKLNISPDINQLIRATFEKIKIG